MTLRKLLIDPRIFDEWCSEYGVPQHHQAEWGSGKHWRTGWDHTHWQDVHIPLK